MRPRQPYWRGHTTTDGNPVESLFQGEGDFELRENSCLAPEGDAIRIQSHNDVPCEVIVEHNVIHASGASIVLVPGVGQGAYRQIVRHNAVVATEPVSAVFEKGNEVATLRAE